jgi:plastocyanin
MSKWLALLCSCLALGLVITGCGGDDDEEEEGGGGGGAARKTVAVTLKDTAFQPADVTVAKGGTVTWTNEDDVGHDVTKTGGSGAEFKSGAPGDMSKGDTFKQTFSTAGEVQYVCTVHAGMEGTITVK